MNLYQAIQGGLAGSAVLDATERRGCGRGILNPDFGLNCNSLKKRRESS
jgi:hypothetical protein